MRLGINTEGGCMKDATHHLKHIQRKVIQFSRKAENVEEQSATSSFAAGASTSLALEAFSSTAKRKRRLFNGLPQAARFR